MERRTKVKNNHGITLIALVISIIVMLILAGVSINAVVGDNGIIGKAQDSTYLQSIAALQEYLQMQYTEYALEDNPYETEYGLLHAKHPEWFYQNAQGYILDSEGHVLYLIKKSGLPDDIKSQIRGGDATKVSQYYRQQDVYGVTSDLQVYYCKNGTSTIMGLTVDDLQKDNPLEIAYEADSLLAQVANNGEAISSQGLKSIKTLTIDTEEKLKLLSTFKDLQNLQIVYFKNISIPNLNGMQFASNVKEVRFTDCNCADYSALCGLSNLNKLYLIRPVGKNAEVSSLCSSDRGIANAEFTNLKYFGIVGNETYIQSTSKDYSGTRYEITDISAFSNFSTVTQESIEYLYLQNLQLTSIASLSGFKNVSILRMEENAITTFQGIENMSKLQYLIAPTCYSNATAKYTLGSAESDTKNTSTDALSYIYKGTYTDEETGEEKYGNNSLYYLDLRNASNIKWTSYLKDCVGIRYLYMPNSTQIKDIDEMASVLGQCGINYQLPSTFTLDLEFHTMSLLNLANQTVTETKFDSIVGNTNLTHLDLYNVKIKKSDNSIISGTELNKKINDTLKTCTSLKRVRLSNISDLSSIEFVKSTPSLIELQLLNTKVTTGTKDSSGNFNGLELLNSNCPDINILYVNTSTINLGNIADCLEKVFREETVSTWSYFDNTSRSFYTNSSTVYRTLANATSLTRISLGGPMNWSGFTVDVSSFQNLTYFGWFYGTQSKFKLPPSVVNISLDQFHTEIDMSLCTGIKSISIHSATPSVVLSTIDSLPANTSLDYLHLRFLRIY